MSANVDQEEVQALIGMSDDGEFPRVAECDFSRPRRLSPERLDGLREALSSACGKAEESFSRLLGVKAGLELASLAETNADHLFDDTPGPLALLRFRSAGQLSWVIWESLAAVRCVESLLGSKAEIKEGRILSNLEATMLQGIMETFVRPLLDSWNIEMTDVEIIQDAAAAGSWRDAEEGADPHRLAAELALEAQEIQSTVHMYLSGLCGQPPGADPAGAEGIPTTVPGHIDGVTVDLQACLAGVEVPLAQLLDLEEGDVIPLGVRAGHPATVMIEGRPVALAEWGVQRGRMAVQVLALNSADEEDL